MVGGVLVCSNLQEAKEEYTAQGELLPVREIQSPDHRYTQRENHEVDEQICDAVPSVELILIDACSPFDGFIPVVGDRSALENGN